MSTPRESRTWDRPTFGLKRATLFLSFLLAHEDHRLKIVRFDSARSACDGVAYDDGSSKRLNREAIAKNATIRFARGLSFAYLPTSPAGHVKSEIRNRMDNV